MEYSIDLHDKELWLHKHGRIMIYGEIAGFESSMRWTSVGGKHITKVKGEGSEAVGRLYDNVKEALFEMITVVETY